MVKHLLYKIYNIFSILESKNFSKKCEANIIFHKAVKCLIHFSEILEKILYGLDKD